MSAIKALNKSIDRNVIYKKSADELEYIATQDHSRITGVCHECHSKKEFGLIIGAPGSGKTTAIKKYKVSNSEVYIITCSRNIRSRTVLVRTAQALGISSYGSAGILEMEIVKHLKKKTDKCLLIYDEADFLDINCLETVRFLMDESENVGIVLCGNESLAEKVLVYAEDKPELARLRDRIGYFQRLSGLGEMEAERFLEGINTTNEARKLLLKIGMKRGIRQLVKALGRLLDVTDGEEINADMVQALGQIVLSFNA